LTSLRRASGGASIARAARIQEIPAPRRIALISQRFFAPRGGAAASPRRRHAPDFSAISH